MKMGRASQIEEMHRLFRERAKYLPDVNGPVLLNGETLNFYMDWLHSMNQMNQEGLSVHYFLTDMYHHVEKKLKTHIQIPFQKAQIYAVRRKLYKRFDSSILDKDMIVFPIHLPDIQHWFLAIIHRPADAIRKKITPSAAQQEEEGAASQDFNNNLDDFDVTVGGGCRIVILDSLYGTKNYGEELKVEYAKVFENLKVWIQLTADFESNIVMTSRIKTVVCKNLPIQKTNFECGIYMLVFAEYFTVYNTEWIDWETEEIENLMIDETVQEHLESGESRKRLNAEIQRWKWK